MKKNNKTLLILGNDKISHKALTILHLDAATVLAIDKSTNMRRVFRLVKQGSLTIGLLAQMAFCEARRKQVKIGFSSNAISSNADVVRLIQIYQPRRVVLFRAGLIINKTVLATGVPVMNIHCAKIPEYGGIGAIARALKDGALKQCATLHQVTESIDAGVVHDIEPYELDPAIGYCANENRAYDAGIRLLQRVLGQKPIYAFSF